jgi:hypothetical protein
MMKVTISIQLKGMKRSITGIVEGNLSGIPVIERFIPFN